MSENLYTLPIWKKDATPYERLSELALLAREHPERFTHFVLVYREILKTGNWKIRTMEFGGDLSANIGLCHIGIEEMLKESTR